MKVITDYKTNVFTSDEMPIVKRIIRYEREDTNTPEDLAKLAMSVVTNEINKELKEEGYLGIYTNDWEIYNANAVMCKNNRVWNYFDDNSRDIDVWIEWLAVTEYYGAVKCGICLSDVYSICADLSNVDDVFPHMYIDKYEPLRPASHTL